MKFGVNNFGYRNTSGRLPPGRRGLKLFPVYKSQIDRDGRLPPGRRGLKSTSDKATINLGGSPPTREAWIEINIFGAAVCVALVASHPGGVD